MRWLGLLCALAACDATGRGGDLDAFLNHPADLSSARGNDLGMAADLATSTDDLGHGSTDMAHGSMDLAHGSTDMARATGIISGGPCSSGATGATAIRVHYTNAGGQAQVNYDAFGLPDGSRENVSVYGYQIGFTSTYDDYFLGVGGLVLDDSDFIDISISTAGVSTIRSATLSIFGRSFDTTTDGSFSWQSFAGTGAAPTDLVSNVAPYSWYSADLGGAIDAGNSMILLRIKSGPSSDSLIVHTLEICLDAA